MLGIAERLKVIKPSATMSVFSKATQLKSEGKPIINLGVGEPDFDTPEHIKKAAIAAIERGDTKYTPVGGTASIKEAIVGKFLRENHLRYSASQVFVSSGCKHSIYNAMQTILNPGDEVIIPSPYWTSYPDMVALTGATPKVVHTSLEQQFKLQPEALDAAINENTRMLIINSPSNPSGICYNTEELQRIADVLLKHSNIWILSDDIYEHIQWRNTQFQNLLSVAPGLYERTIVCNGVSKSYAMTGWRIGYVGAPEIVVKGMTTIQSQSTSNPCSISQAAAIAALQGDTSYFSIAKTSFIARHKFVYDALMSIPSLRCNPAEGTFYIFPDISAVIKRLNLPQVKDDVTFSEYLLNETHVAVVPGSAFGSPGFIRLSFATSMENLARAMEKIKALLQQ